MLKSEVAVNNVNHVRKKMRVVHCGHSFVTRATQAVLKPRWEYFSSEHLVGGTQWGTDGCYQRVKTKRV